MTLTKLHSNKTYASRAGEFYRTQRDKGNCTYHCPEKGCLRSFYNKAQLDAHLLGHSGEKPHRCEHCEYASRQKYLLDRHRERAHGIPLPSTRISRSRARKASAPRFFSTRITAYTGLMPTIRSVSTDIQRRVLLYKRSDNILELLEPTEATTFITRKQFSIDKRHGYIIDSYYIGEYGSNRNYKFGRGEKQCKKMVDILNQLNTIQKMYPLEDSKEDYEREIQLFKMDNKKATAMIEKSIRIINKEFK